jgi:MFS family permease
MRRLLGHRDARIYLTGQLFSLFGDSSLWLAMGIWVKTLTQSNAEAGLVFFFFTAPSLLAPASGLLVDRLRRRPLLIATNAITGVAVLVLLAVHGPGQVWLIDLVMFTYGLSYGVLGPAQSALLTVMVPADLLADANGALNSAQQVMRLIGPLIGAGLFVAVGAHVIAIIDAGTFAVPVITLFMLRVSEPPPQPAVAHWTRQVVAGVRHVWQTVQLRQVIAAGAATTTVFGFTETINYAIVSSGLHRPAAFVGVLASVQGAGAVIGGLSAATLIRRTGEGRLITIAMFLAAAGAALLASVIAGDVLFGAAIAWVVVGLITLVQRLTPPDLQGRVYAAVETLITTPQTLSIALGAGLITITGYQPLLIAMAAVITLAAAYLLTRPEQRPAQPRAGVTHPGSVPERDPRVNRHHRPRSTATPERSARPPCPALAPQTNRSTAINRAAATGSSPAGPVSARRSRHRAHSPARSVRGRW